MNGRTSRFLTAYAGLALAATQAARLPAAEPVGQPPPAPPAAGHSWHGETFNEGPRQRAYLMQNTGPVNFPVSTSSPEAQEFVNQGIGQLHGFWYFEAERSFRQAAALDPNCAMAYWGMALANTNNVQRSKGFLAEAVKRKAGITEHETLYIDALDAFHKADAKKDKERHEAYAKALERIIYKNPADIEAKALLGLQLWLNRSHGTPIASHLAVDALLKEVLAVEPAHPCHHYRIHLWDDERPQNALDSAARCGQSAASIAHMWHMSGHIFSDLQRYGDAAWQQEASARVDHAYMIRDRVLPDQIHNYAHNNEWLIRDLGHVGRVRDAVRLARNMIEIPRHPRFNTLANGSAHLGRLRLFEELARYELWDELLALAETSYLEPTDVTAEQVKRLRYIGIALIRKGDVPRGIEHLRMLEERLHKERYKLNIAEPPPAVAATASVLAGDELRPETVPLPTPEEDGRLRQIELAIDELKGYLAVEQGDYRAGLPLLKKAGGVNPVYLAKIEFLAGDREAGLKNGREAVNRQKNQVQPLAELVELLWRAGEEKEAGERFQQLRDISGQIDIEAPVFARLTPIAASLNLPADWRIVKPPEPDVGVRPPLDSLGPIYWQPQPAPEWDLSDGKGGRLGSAQFRGKPVVVIFYLGYQCLHCAEQLQAFAPLTNEFQDAGISLVAISTDDDAGLAKSIENYKSGTFPFPLASDPTLGTFKACRAHDDFENRPLHGTFLIDGAGLVRWQDISFEPFRDARFVLNEARRLLAISTGPPSGAAPASVSTAGPGATDSTSTPRAP
jgi:peroxiredoxin/tetratricopeptide (TPR) repeat protein